MRERMRTMLDTSYDSWVERHDMVHEAHEGVVEYMGRFAVAALDYLTVDEVREIIRSTVRGGENDE